VAPANDTPMDSSEYPAVFVPVRNEAASQESLATAYVPANGCPRLERNTVPCAPVRIGPKTNNAKDKRVKKCIVFIAVFSLCDKSKIGSEAEVGTQTDRPLCCFRHGTHKNFQAR